MQVVVVAALLAAMAARRDATRDVVAVLPVGTADWLDDPAGQRDGRDAPQAGRDVRRGDPAGCREGLCQEDLADRPGGQAERRVGRVAYPDGRDGRPEDVCQADPAERRVGDPVHPDAMRREAA